MSLPPTTDSLFNDDARPYFLWWTDATVGQFKEHLSSSDPEERAYKTFVRRVVQDSS